MTELFRSRLSVMFSQYQDETSLSRAMLECALALNDRERDQFLAELIHEVCCQRLTIRNMRRQAATSLPPLNIGGII
ncbi:hypothetical protein [Palleronia caenipelagi]|uniref:Uncharacterized protein n=1 Tax=Palleronia caenipelagi TaxID=2489174 RepID=A0A547Q6A3_9RHOB|nr:hypothetical protein [Palleronia caenipelagi]TRD21890.1 hypothetical protein FEV53_07525 [Palleronia caenipelagi]